MTNRILIFIFFMISVSQVQSQIIVDSTVNSFLSKYPKVKIVPIARDTTYWKSKTKAEFLLSENYYKNWNSGGDNIVSGLLKVNWIAIYNRDRLKWAHYLKTEYGVNRQEDQDIRKTNDLIEYTSNLGYMIVEKWYATTQVRFNTQFTNGYNYVDDGNHVLKTGFLSPAKIFIGVGMKYTKGNELYLYVSPFTENTTWVVNDSLAAIGDINKNKQRVYNKIGPWIDFLWNYRFYKEYHLINKVSLYSDYIHEFGSLDYFDWQLDLSMPLHKYLTLHLGFHVRYEKDILFDVEGSTSGEKETRVQFKQLLGIGFKYEF